MTDRTAPAAFARMEPLRIVDMAADSLTGAAAWIANKTADPKAPKPPAELDPALMRAVAEAARKDPRADPCRTLPREMVDVLVPEQTERLYSLSEIVTRLLNAAADYADMRKDVPITERFTDIGEWRAVADMTAMSPEGAMDAEFQRLQPFLRHASAIQRGEAPDAGHTALSRRQYEHEGEFRATVLRAYELMHGGDLTRHPIEGQLAWAANMVPVWLRQRGPLPAPLDAREIEQIAFNLSRPRQDWFMEPLLPGAWCDLSETDAAAVMAVVSEVQRVGETATPLPLVHGCDRVRVRDLACFGGVLLIEMQGYLKETGEPGLISLLMSETGVVVGDGTSAPVHDTCDRWGAQLETAQARLDYLHLFTNWVRGDDGRFQIIETPDQLVRRSRDPAWSLKDVAKVLKPVREAGQDEDGRWLLDATVAYGDALFEARFALDSTGLIEMMDDNPVAEGLPIWPERQDGPLLRRIVEPTISSPSTTQTRH